MVERTYSAAKCLECGKVIWSENRHDYQVCKCPQGTMIDGGDAYIRCGGIDMTKLLLGRYNKKTKEFIPNG